MTAAVLFTIAAAAALISAITLGPFIGWAAARQIVAVPNARSSHRTITPVGGGVPIAICLIVAAGAVGWREAAADWWPAYVVGAVAVFAVSWLDDVRGAATWLRLLVHVLAATAVVIAAGVSSIDWAGAGAGGAALAVFWIVGVTNAYNFMDGIDGIAGTQAVAAGAAWALVGSQIGLPLAAVMGSVMAGASLGFLWHNWAPARVFMGDVGSAPLGFTLATLSVVVVPTNPAAAVAGALAIWPFIGDAAFTLIRRLVAGENVFAAHRSHLYQRLVTRGWSHASVTTLYGALALAGLGLGQFVIARGLAQSWVVASTTVLVMFGALCFAAMQARNE